jgi:hypothetical protein
MENMISPKYHMKLAYEVDKAIRKEFNSLDDISAYIDRWAYPGEQHFNQEPEFYIQSFENREINLPRTLQKMESQILLKIAVDMGVETPDFIPSIASFRNEIKSDYKTASATFEKAFKEIESHPAIAIGLANSALESIIKEIIKDERLNTIINGNKNLYDLASELLKVFKLFPIREMPVEIKAIGSGLLAACQGIEKIRSEKSDFHGKTSDDYMVTDPLYAYFIVNSVTTVGLFLKSYYIKKFPEIENNLGDITDLPF